MAVHYVDSVPIGFGLGCNAERGFLLSIANHGEQLEKHKFPCDPEILGIEHVAHILRCSVDKVRRLSRHKLPARKGPGKALLYLRSDVLEFARSLSITNDQFEIDDDEQLHRGTCFDVDAAKKRISEK